MAFDEALAGRVRAVLAGTAGATEKKMFGGLAFLVRGNMSVGVFGSELMVRLAPTDKEKALEEPGTRSFDMAGRPTKGFILVAPEAVRDKKSLAKWVERGVGYASSLPAK